jgi:hypothetical protein
MELIAPIRMRSILAIIAGLAVSSCGTTPVAPEQLAPNIYVFKSINGKIYSKFIEMKMPGTVEISSVHNNEALGTPAQWAICLRNDAGKGINYFVFLIDQNEIVDYRGAIQLDRCSEQSYAPLLRSQAPKFVPPTKRDTANSRQKIIVPPARSQQRVPPQ